MKLAISIGTVLAFASFACGETFTAVIDPAESSITATLTIAGGFTDSDVSPVGGTVRLNLANVNTPLNVTGIDFDLAVTETLDFYIAVFLAGNLTSTVTDLHLIYAEPGTLIGPVPLTGPTHAFAFNEVPASLQGVLHYTATGVVCAGFVQAGLPCDDTDDLSSEPVQPIDFSGSLSVSEGRLVTLRSTVDRTMPIDPENPGLGTLRVQGMIYGTAVVPVILGDANGDCAVDFSDITSILSNYGGTGSSGDANNSGSVDFADITAALSNWGSIC